MGGAGRAADAAGAGAGLPLERVQHHGAAVRQGGAIPRHRGAGDGAGRGQEAAAGTAGLLPGGGGLPAAAAQGDVPQVHVRTARRGGELPRRDRQVEAGASVTAADGDGAAQGGAGRRPAAS